MAGKELGGIEQADADLFQDAAWLVAPIAGKLQGRQPELVALAESLAHAHL
jgi:hypothetical protein